MKFFKQIFCKHRFVFVRNIYGDQINYSGGKRSIWECPDCEKAYFSGYLFPVENAHKSFEKFKLPSAPVVFPKKYLRGKLIQSMVFLTSSVLFAISSSLFCLPTFFLACYCYTRFWRMGNLRILEEE